MSALLKAATCRRTPQANDARCLELTFKFARKQLWINRREIR